MCQATLRTTWSYTSRPIERSYNEINSGRCQRRPTPQQSRCEAVTVSRKQTTSLVLFAVSILPSCVDHLQSYPSTIMSTQTTEVSNSERCIPATIKEATNSSDEVGGCTVQGCQCPMFKRATGDNCSTRNCGHHYNHRKFLLPKFHAKANWRRCHQCRSMYGSGLLLPQIRRKSSQLYQGWLRSQL